jgi:hypothetical protein
MTVNIPTTQKVVADINKMSDKEKLDVFDTLVSFICAPWSFKKDIAWNNQILFRTGVAERILICLVQAHISQFDLLDILEQNKEMFLLCNPDLLQELLQYNLEILALCREEGIHGAFLSRAQNRPEPSEDSILFARVMDNHRLEFRYILYECWLIACKRTKREDQD